MTRTQVAALTTAAVVGGAIAYTTTNNPSHHRATQCGVERWAVKTLTDTHSRQVDLSHVYRASIAVLGRYTSPVAHGPNDFPTRLAPIEDHVYKVTATLDGFKRESDSDYHLGITDGLGHYMIAEIPDPRCAPHSRVAAQLSAVRQDFDRHEQVSDRWHSARVPITLTGVAFLDKIHGQRDVAPNGIELHPVLSITWH